MTPSAAGLLSRNAFKAAVQRIGLTRVPPSLQTPTPSATDASSSSRTRTTIIASTSTNTTIEEREAVAMANVQVQKQPQGQPHQYDQHQHHPSALQAPLPRHVPHYSALRRPIPNSYWATPYLLACEYPWAPSTPRPKLDALLAAGVRTFIDLTESGELLGYSQLLPVRAHSCGLPPSESNTIEYFRFPIPDRSLPASPAFLARILGVLARCESQRRIAAVHCRGGIGRTGTVVGCWLVQSGRCRDGEEALEFIAKQWCTVEKHTRFPCSPETGAQADFVRNFKRLPVSVSISTSTSTTSTTSTSTSIASSTSAISISTTADTSTTSVDQESEAAACA